VEFPPVEFTQTTSSDSTKLLRKRTAGEVAREEIKEAMNPCSVENQRRAFQARRAVEYEQSIKEVNDLVEERVQKI